MRAVVTEQSFINHVETDAEPYRWIGVDYENREHEVEGLKTSGYFSLHDLSEQVADALKLPLAYGQPFTPGQRQARLFSHSRSYQWDETLTSALPLGEISSRGLRHHTEQAAVTPEMVQSLFQGKLSQEQVADEAGYRLDQGYWWSRGVIQHYHTAPGLFFLLRQVNGAFAGVDPQGALNPTFTLTYDDYSLLPVQTTQYLQGAPSSSDSPPDPTAVVLTVKSDNDYQSLNPCRITDANGNVDEALYDPLGLLAVTTNYGTEAGQLVGDEPLADYHLQPAPTFEDVLNNPQKYLQNATVFYFYDLLAWADRRQPASAVSLQRRTFLHNLASMEADLIQTGITYSDGFGRVVESKLKTAPAPAALRRARASTAGETGVALVASDENQRWIVSGRTVYNNKGDTAEQYLPWFSPVPDYEEYVQMPSVPPTGFHYDAIGRLIRTDTPKGFFTKVEFSPWEMKTYDEDDTVKDSTFYINFPAKPTTPGEKNERDALDKAAAFYNTPAVDILDTLGRIVRSLQNNLGAVTAGVFDGIVAGSGVTAQQLWDELVTASYLKRAGREPTAAWVTDKLRPYDAAFQQTFKEQFNALAGPVLELLKANGLTTLHELDISGREVRSTDPRLLYTNVTQGTDYHNFSYVYDMLGSLLSKNSADAGLNLSLDNVFQNDYWNWSARDFEQIISYDRLQRRVQVRVKANKPDGTLLTDSVVETYA